MGSDPVILQLLQDMKMIMLLTITRHYRQTEYSITSRNINAVRFGINCRKIHLMKRDYYVRITKGKKKKSDSDDRPFFKISSKSTDCIRHRLKCMDFMQKPYRLKHRGKRK